MRRLLVSLAATAFFCLAPIHPAAAEDNPKAALQHFDSATRLYKLGRFREALAEFEGAYLDKADPAFLFNIGQCQRMLGQREPALRAYRNYLRDRPDAINRKDVESLIAELERPQPSPPTSTVPPTTPAAGVEASHGPERPPGASVTPVLQAGAPATDEGEAASPLVRRWWFWVAVGGAAVVVTAAAVGIAYAVPDNASPPPGGVGTYTVGW